MAQQYFYRQGNQNVGPLSVQEILASGIDIYTTYVWAEGMETWKLAKDVADFHISAQPTPPPNPPQNQNPYPSQNNGAANQGYLNADPIGNSDLNNTQRQTNTQQNRNQRPQNYLILSVVCTLLCCMPLGVVGIIKASKVNKLYDEGKIAEANQNAEEAKKFATIGIVVGFIVQVIAFFVGMNQ